MRIHRDECGDGRECGEGAKHTVGSCHATNGEESRQVAFSRASDWRARRRRGSKQMPMLAITQARCHTTHHTTTLYTTSYSYSSSSSFVFSKLYRRCMFCSFYLFFLFVAVGMVSHSFFLVSFFFLLLSSSERIFHKTSLYCIKMLIICIKKQLAHIHPHTHTLTHIYIQIQALKQSIASKLNCNQNLDNESSRVEIGPS